MFDMIVAWVIILSLAIIASIILSCVRIDKKSEAYSYGAPIKTDSKYAAVERKPIPINILGVDYQVFIEYIGYGKESGGPLGVIIQDINIQMPNKPIVNQLEIKLKQYLKNRDFI